jgi:cold shock protein
MSQRRVKWYSANLGHGFNLPDDEGAELLVVHEDIVGSRLTSLENNARVSYEATQGKKGMQADNVSLA